MAPPYPVQPAMTSQVPVVTSQVPVVTSQPTPLPPLADGVEIRKMIHSDSEIIGGMMVDAFEGKFLWAVGANNMDAVRRYMGDLHKTAEKNYHRVFVATYLGKPAGQCVLRYHGDPADLGHLSTDQLPCRAVCGLAQVGCVLDSGDVQRGECYVDHICVDSNVRGKGLGKALLAAAEAEARTKGCTVMTLYVARENRAKNLYEREGYRITKHEDGCCFTWCCVGVRHFLRMEKPLY